MGEKNPFLAKAEIPRTVPTSITRSAMKRLLLYSSPHTTPPVRAPTIAVNGDSAALSCHVYPSHRPPCPPSPASSLPTPQHPLCSLGSSSGDPHRCHCSPASAVRPHRPGAGALLPPAERPKQYADRTPRPDPSFHQAKASSAPSFPQAKASSACSPRAWFVHQAPARAPNPKRGHRTDSVRLLVY